MQIIEKITSFIEGTDSRMDVVFDLCGPSILISTPSYRNSFLDITNRGCKIKCITEVTPDNIELIKQILGLVTELRHLDGIKGGFAITEDEYIATSTIHSEKPLDEVYYSNVEAVVEQGRYTFDTFWRNAIPIEKRISEIENGIPPEVIETIHDPVKLQFKVMELLNRSNEEILVVFSTANAFHRQRRAGSIDFLKEVGKIKPNIRIKILTPQDSVIHDICSKLVNSANFQFKFIEPMAQASILVVDRKYSLVAELKDDTKQTIAESIGFATYSNSIPTVSTYAMIFDIIWNQTSMYDRLKDHDRMQKEFMDAVAHELRTPLTPIIGLTKIVKDKIKNEDQIRLLDIVLYNGIKLHSLSENILALTKMEGKLYSITKKNFDLNLVLLAVINDCKTRLEKIPNFRGQRKKSIEFEYSGFDKKHMVNADKSQIIQVVHNLIDNAINFILDKKGTIIISIENRSNQPDQRGNFVVVHIRDNGEGIHPEMKSRLFSRFATKSFYGTGLGLYISKEIIERHDGKIWGKNNTDSAGATFSFGLPVTQ